MNLLCPICNEKMTPSKYNELNQECFDCSCVIDYHEETFELRYFTLFAPDRANPKFALLISHDQTTIYEYKLHGNPIKINIIDNDDLPESIKEKAKLFKRIIDLKAFI